MPKRVKATPEEEQEVEEILAEAKSEPEPKHCVFCDLPATDFSQPGKDFRGKWVCPDCVLLI